MIGNSFYSVSFDFALGIFSKAYLLTTGDATSKKVISILIESIVRRCFEYVLRVESILMICNFPSSYR